MVAVSLYSEECLLLSARVMEHFVETPFTSSSEKGVISCGRALSRLRTTP